MAGSQQPPPADQRAAAIAAALGVYVTAAGTVAGATAAGGGFVALNAWMIRLLSRLFLRWRYRRTTIRWALEVVTRVVVSYAPADATDAAAAAYARAARVYAAWFVEAATARIEAAGDDWQTQVDRENRYVQQHLEAQRKRQEAARRVDVEADKPGQVVDGDRVILWWRAHPDDRVTPECRAADGAWFYADTPPVIGYPGMPHGGTCRCWPAHAGSLAEVARGRSVDESVRGIISRDPDHRPHPVVVGPDVEQEAS